MGRRAVAALFSIVAASMGKISRKARIALKKRKA